MGPTDWKEPNRLHTLVAMIATYQPSGKCSLAVVPWLLGAFAWSVAVMFVYQLAVRWNPLIYVNFLLTLATGLAIGQAIRRSVKWGRCRNPVLAAACGLMIGAMAIGAKYGFQYDAEIRSALDTKEVKEMVDELERDEQVELSPADVTRLLKSHYSFWKFTEDRVERGWELGLNRGLQIRGPLVYLVWLFETGVILTLCGVMPYKAAGQPYNERINEWADEREVVGRFSVNAATVESLATATSLESLLFPPAVEVDSPLELIYQSHSIAGDELEHAYLSLAVTIAMINRKGETATKERMLHEFVVLSPENRKLLLERIASTATPP